MARPVDEDVLEGGGAEREGAEAAAERGREARDEGRAVGAFDPHRGPDGGDARGAGAERGGDVGRERGRPRVGLGDEDDDVAPDLARQVGGRAERDEAPPVEDPDARGLLRLVEEVRREEDGRAAARELGEERAQAPARERVEAGGRLVEEEDLGIVEKPRREVQASLCLLYTSRCV